jgi:hypothetical protein
MKFKRYKSNEQHLKKIGGQSLTGSTRTFSFLRTYNTLSEILTDRKLASLGDAYVNFVYSLALSERKGKPTGDKVRGAMLAQALRKAGLRILLPSRADRHALSDAAEALLVCAWLCKLLTLEESVQTPVSTTGLEDGLTQLLRKAGEQIRLSGLSQVPC